MHFKQDMKWIVPAMALIVLIGCKQDGQPAPSSTQSSVNIPGPKGDPGKDGASFFTEKHVFRFTQSQRVVEILRLPLELNEPKSIAVSMRGALADPSILANPDAEFERYRCDRTYSDYTIRRVALPAGEKLVGVLGSASKQCEFPDGDTIDDAGVYLSECEPGNTAEVCIFAEIGLIAPVHAVNAAADRTAIFNWNVIVLVD